MDAAVAVLRGNFTTKIPIYNKKKISNNLTLPFKELINEKIN